MKNWIHLPAAGLIAGLVGFGASLVSAPARGASAAPAPQPGELEALRTRLAQLEHEQAELARELATRTAAPATTARLPLQDLDQAIAAYMARQLTRAEEAPRGERPGQDPEIAAIVDRILLGQVSGDELEALWHQLRQDKRIDAVLAAMEREATRAPNDPDLQDELGKAYIQKLFDVGAGPLAAQWGEKADQTFDRALELDPEHWDARFQKAIALSNWPAFLGKQGEAARQLEILRDQQERARPSARHAATYFFLGNLYEQMGQHEQAAATWARGLERFPDDARLRAKRSN